VPLPDLCALGGWKDTQTILKCYQKPDAATMQAALAARVVRSALRTDNTTDSIEHVVQSKSPARQPKSLRSFA
jgi:hypothetical protein